MSLASVSKTLVLRKHWAVLIIHPSMQLQKEVHLYDIPGPPAVVFIITVDLECAGMYER